MQEAELRDSVAFSSMAFLLHAYVEELGEGRQRDLEDSVEKSTQNCNNLLSASESVCETEAQKSHCLSTNQVFSIRKHSEK